ncbi:MAG: flagellar biosynthesis protein FlhB [Planctomycetota bacterium]|jgi:flagellar biosynthetic protein FlhB
MPDKPAADRTEPATEKRISDARKKGQIAQSQEVPTALATAALLVVLALTVSNIYGWLHDRAVGGMFYTYQGSLNRQVFLEIFQQVGTEVLVLLLPFVLAGVFVAFASSLITSGWAICPQAVGFKPERCNPVKGFRNLFTMKSLQKLLISVAKLFLLGFISYMFLQEKANAVLDLKNQPAASIVHQIATMTMGLMVRLGLTLLVIAFVDLLYQRWKHKRDLRMTKQEVKEETKQHEVSGEVKGRRRAVQIEMARKRMLQEVPEADVVITNPTHYAVAIKYDVEQTPAPMVLAKGADMLAQKIREIATANKVPVIRRPPLARALYNSCEPGEMIPQTLFVAVAEVLAMIFRMNRKHKRVGRLVSQA